VMGDRGMGDMTEMEMPLPDNTVPMMTGEGPFGSLEMGGMVSVVKVRKNQKPSDYRDPGWYQAPKGTRATEWTGPLAEAPRTEATSAQATTEVTVRKPTQHQH